MVLTIFWLVVALIVAYVAIVELRRQKGVDQPQEQTDEEKLRDEKSGERWGLIGGAILGFGYAAWVLVKFWKTGEIPARSEMFK